MARSRVVIRILDDHAHPVVLATISLDEAGQVQCDREDLLKDWNEQGITERSSEGRLFPSDGARFMRELPNMYRSAYCWAELVDGD